jgi:hypothetical protein
MKRKRSRVEQVAYAITQAQGGTAVTAIRQATIAGQQVVMNAENPAGSPSNEQGCRDGATQSRDARPTALPPLAGRAGLAPGLGGAGEALGAVHRAEDGRGQGEEPDERVEAWGAVPRGPGGPGDSG